jgi:hypothetical protein
MKMRTLTKYTAAAVLTGAMALAAATPSEARNGRNAAAIGFGVGAVAGAAIASSAYNGGYYGYYGEPAYAYAPGYAYEPYGYAYEPYGYYGYAYAPAPSYRYYYPRWQDEHSTNNFGIESQR